MAEMIAYCGLVCTRCPTYLATQSDDDAAREKTATMLAEKYGLQLPPEAINCDGCLSSGSRRMGYCDTCAVRKCAAARGVEHCAVCEDQPCDALNAFHAFSPEAKAAFEALLPK